MDLEVSKNTPAQKPELIYILATPHASNHIHDLTSTSYRLMHDAPYKTHHRTL